EDTADAVLASLDPLYAVGQAAARALPRGSRILYVMPPQGTHAAATIAQSSVEGFARALGKELGKQGTTVHVLRPGQGAPRGFAKVAAFLGGPRSSFLHLLSLDVDQDVRAQPVAVPVPGTGAKKRALEGKVALITGAGRGIGAAVAEALAREGADIAINDLPSAERSASRVLARLRKLGVRAAFLPFDVATKEGVTELRAAIGAEFGRLDILVNNAGITRDKTLKRMKRELWDLGVKVNLGSQLRVTEAVEDLLQPGGAVVNLSSVMGIAGNFGQTNYSAAKAGVIGFTKVLAERLGQRGVTVNALAPGYIKTRLTHQMPLLNREMAKQLTALLQPGEAEDIADIITFLASPDGASVHGQVIRVDGGMAIGK
ncbi:MAG: SDR family oxidoreductase, partial [Planctomycetota bacterium]